MHPFLSRFFSWFLTLPLWLRLIHHCTRFPQPAQLPQSSISLLLSAIEQSPASHHPLLATIAHLLLIQAVLTHHSPDNLAYRSSFWPFALRFNSACLRAGLRMPFEHIQTTHALIALLTCQASFHDKPLPDAPSADSRMQYFWNSVASDQALYQYWTPQRCSALFPSHCASHFEPLALSCLATGRISPELAAALTRLHRMSPLKHGPFSSLILFPISHNDRWLFHGWAPCLLPLARQLALISPPLLFDLFELAYNAPERFRHYCPADPLSAHISLHHCLSSICDDSALREHFDVLSSHLSGLHASSPALFAAIERVGFDLDFPHHTPSHLSCHRL